MSSFLTVHSYTNNAPKGHKPRIPLVHMLANGNEFGDVQSITFHPDDAYAVAAAITSAADAALKGLRRKAIRIELKPQC